jgi:hypothetical protein
MPYTKAFFLIVVVSAILLFVKLGRLLRPATAKCLLKCGTGMIILFLISIANGEPINLHFIITLFLSAIT